MSTLHDRVQAAAAKIRSAWGTSPAAGIVLGTGLGALAGRIQVEAKLRYEDVPGFPRATGVGHAGNLVLGRLAGRPVAALEGRFHLYEGHSIEDVTLPIRVLKALGAPLVILSNAAGGMNPQYRGGDIVLIEDHINLTGVSPLSGPNDDRLGPRFPDMIEPYDHRLIELAEGVAMEERIRTWRGVYAGVLGPHLETRAEYRHLRRIGADMVGMSTVAEVIVAVHAGLKVLGLSVITDTCFPDALKPVDIHEILRVAGEAEPRLTTLVTGVVARLPGS